MQQIFSDYAAIGSTSCSKILSHSQIVTYSSRQLVSHIKEYAPKAKIIRIPYCVNDVKFRTYGISEQACWEMKERLRLNPMIQVSFAGQLLQK